MGSSLSSPEFVALNLETACKVKANGGTISFDPNLRKEILNTPGLRDAMADVLSLTDVFLPSGEELTLLTDAGDPAIAAKELLALGLQYVVHKMGSGGVRIYDTSGTRFFPAYSVTEIDPTGAGDCFGGAFIALWLQGLDIDKVVSLASAAGACAVQHRGPMEGALRLETLDRFVKEYEDQQNIVGGTR
jgi:sugar/nucleoside kinase (ribokinase family)